MFKDWLGKTTQIYWCGPLQFVNYEDYAKKSNNSLYKHHKVHTATISWVDAIVTVLGITVIIH